MTREDHIWEEIERIEANREAGCELGRRMGDWLFIALCASDKNDIARLETLHGELRLIELERLNNEEWSDHWTLNL